MIYKHTHIGYLIIMALIIPLPILFFTTTVTEFAQIPPMIFFTFLLALTLFYSLTVKIDKTKLVLKFGCGLISKKFILKNIQSCHTVKNPWYYGWGIRITPHGWLYNISGLSAVQIQLINGKKYRIGTDEPASLKHAITQAIQVVK